MYVHTMFNLVKKCKFESLKHAQYEVVHTRVSRFIPPTSQLLSYNVNNNDLLTVQNFPLLTEKGQILYGVSVEGELVLPTSQPMMDFDLFRTRF